MTVAKRRQAVTKPDMSKKNLRCEFMNVLSILSFDRIALSHGLTSD